MGSINIERIHPLEGGFLRRRYRLDRRPGLPVEPAWRFYPRHYGSVAGRLARWAFLYLRLRRIYVGIKNDPRRYVYTDQAMTPVGHDETETHELFGTAAAQAYVEQRRRVKQIQDGAGLAPAGMP
jgi:hypothetical protein